MYQEDIILSEVTQSQKTSLDMHSLISGYQPRDLESQDTICKKLKHKKIKKEGQCVDTSFFLRTKYLWKELKRQSLELKRKDVPSRDYPPPPPDPTPNHAPNTDTIAYASKNFFSGPGYNSLL